MNKIHFYTAIILLLCCLGQTAAQKSTEFEGITSKKIEMLASRHLNSFQMSLQRLTAHNLDETTKEKEIALCRKLFTPDALIETKGLNNYKKSWKVSEYLRTVTFPPSGTDIDITFLRNPVITGIEKVDDKTYKVQGTLLQRYRKEKKTGQVYEDITVKTAWVRIEQIIDNGNIVYQIKIYKIDADQVFKT